MSLVPEYEDSDSDENNDTSNDYQNKTTSQVLHDNKDNSNSATSDSEDDSTTTNASITSVSTNSISTATKLPTPGFLSKANGKYLPTNSVFSNPFVEAENAKKTALEKHVKMVDGGTAITINGKKVCWNYRKGRCRFGHNCKYAHDSDLQKTKTQLAEENQLQETILCQSSDAKAGIQQSGDVKYIASNAMNNLSKRKRPGLTQGLQPGKRVLKQYHNLKNHQSC